MKQTRTQLIAWYSGDPEMDGDYIVKTKHGHTVPAIYYLSKWIEMEGEGWTIPSEEVIEWTLLP